MNLWLLAATIAMLACGQASAKGNLTKVYIFGFAASFNDSIVHFTDIQTIDSAWTDKKTRFLLGRENYSYQLRDYLANSRQMPHRTCIVVYNTEKDKLEKEYLKMKRLYTEKGAAGKYDIKLLAASDFSFEAVDMSAVEEEPQLTKAERKAKKQLEKKARKEDKIAKKAAKKAKKKARKEAKAKEKLNSKKNSKKQAKTDDKK